MRRGGGNLPRRIIRVERGSKTSRSPTGSFALALLPVLLLVVVVAAFVTGRTGLRDCFVCLSICLSVSAARCVSSCTPRRCAHTLLLHRTPGSSSAPC